MDTNGVEVLVFGPFTLDSETGELRENGELVALRPKAMAVLVELVNNAGSLVPREKLFAAAWGDAHVEEDSALHNVIRDIRQALGESGAEPRYVATVHRRGYRFIARVARKIERSEPPVLAPKRGPFASRTWPALVAPLLLLILAAAVLGERWRPAEPGPADPILSAPADVLRAREILSRGGSADIHRGAELLRERVVDRPGALAWSGLAVAELRLGRLEAARSAAQQALALSPSVGDAHRVLGQIEVARGDRAVGESHLLRALELEPASSQAYHAWALYLASEGELDDAVAIARKARELGPWHGVTQANLMRFLLYSRDYEAVLREASSCNEAADPVLDIRASCLNSVQAAAWMLDDFETARETLAQWISAVGGPEDVLAQVREVRAERGLEAALRWRISYFLRQLDTDPRLRVPAAIDYVQLGELEAAVQLLLPLTEPGSRRGPVIWRHDPRLDLLRSRPELAEFFGPAHGGGAASL